MLENIDHIDVLNLLNLYGAIEATTDPFVTWDYERDGMTMKERLDEAVHALCMDDGPQYRGEIEELRDMFRQYRSGMDRVSFENMKRAEVLVADLVDDGFRLELDVPKVELPFTEEELLRFYKDMPKILGDGIAKALMASIEECSGTDTPSMEDNWYRRFAIGVCVRGGKGLSLEALKELF